MFIYKGNKVLIKKYLRSEEEYMKRVAQISISVCIAIMAAIVMFSGMAVGQEGMQVLKSQVTMQPANSAKDPYSLQFMLNPTAPGRIAVLVRKPDKGVHLKKGQNLFRIIIMDERGVVKGTNIIKKKYFLKTAFFGNERGLLEYSVDQVELDQIRGKYLVVISNFYDKNAYRTDVIIRYPVLKVAAEQTIRPVEMKKFTEED
jgi:hypothetical protein